MFCLALCIPAYAQGDAASATAAPAAHPGISLDIVVTPKNGPPVSGLQQNDFKLLDNKVPAPITSFRAFSGTQPPAEVVLVVDAVNVPYSGVSYMRGQIEKFLRANGGQLPLPTSLVIFTDTGLQVQGGFTKDGNAEAASLDHATIALRNINRSAGYWGAAEQFENSVNALRQLAAREASRPGRKLVVWISPGWPLLSGPGVQLDGKQENALFSDIKSLSTDLRRSGVTLYNVNPIGAAEGPGRTFYYQEFVKGVSKPGQVEPADLSLQVLATQSGGLVLTSSNDLLSELQKCFDDGLAYYEVTFNPGDADTRDQYHSIDVQVSKPNLTARTWTGYYSQP
jgi:VWFA-related protein